MFASGFSWKCPNYPSQWAVCLSLGLLCLCYTDWMRCASHPQRFILCMLTSTAIWQVSFPFPKTGWEKWGTEMKVKYSGSLQQSELGHDL